jgi:type IX secretion system PorP/SprF family membrane protein
MVQRFLFLLLLLATLGAQAQQAPRLSQFNFATALYNPSAAGATDQLTIGGAFRGQWLGIDGAPNTQVLFIDKSTDRVGLGFQMRNDKAGNLGISDFNAAYAYKLPLTSTLVLRGGVAASVANWRNNFSNLLLDDTDDPQFLNNYNRWLPNFGAGVQLQHNKWQIGFGVPQLFEHNLNETNNAIAAHTFRHYFIHANANIELNDNQLQIQPQIVLVNSTWFNKTKEAAQYKIGSPTTADFGVTAIVQEQWKLGMMWRSALQRTLTSDHALGFKAGWISPKGFTVSAVYEVPLNAIRKVSNGSFEIMMTYTPPGPQSSKQVQPPTSKPEIPIVPPPPAAVVPPPPAAAPPSIYQVQGIVFDMTTGLPTEGARITLANTCGSPIPDAFITTADGRYHFDLEVGCCYTVTAQKDGRKTANSAQLCAMKSAEGQILRADLDLQQP